jgi:hypothetical protein
MGNLYPRSNQEQDFYRIHATPSVTTWGTMIAAAPLSPSL